jgi:hypothetical protein
LFTRVYSYSLDVSECGRPPNYFSTSALEWFCLYHAQQRGTDGKVPCTSFAKCKTFGNCQPTDHITASESFTDEDGDAAAAAVAAHVESQKRLGSLASPVMAFERWALEHVALDDALLPALMNKQDKE